MFQYLSIITWSGNFSIFNFDFCDEIISRQKSTRVAVINPKSLFIAFFFVVKRNLLITKVEFSHTNLTIHTLWKSRQYRDIKRYFEKKLTAFPPFIFSMNSPLIVSTSGHGIQCLKFVNPVGIVAFKGVTSCVSHGKTHVRVGRFLSVDHLL